MDASCLAELSTKLKTLTPDWVDILSWREEWLAGYAHDYQLPPDWVKYTIWSMLAGRGAGKTRTAAQETGWWALSEPGSRTLLIAPTAGDIRDVIIEGDSGILNVIPTKFIKTYNRSLSEIVFTNGSTMKGIPASEPQRFRGQQANGALYDELAAYDYLKDTWDLSRMCLRLGTRTKTMITTTPKPVPLLKKLVEREGKDVFISRASSYQNLINLSDNFKDELLRYEGTEYGRQEIHGEILNFDDAGILKRSWLRMWPSDRPLPELITVIISADTAFTDKTENDRSAFTVWGVFNYLGTTNAILLDSWAERLNYPDLRERARNTWNDLYNEVKPSIFLMEDKGSGISLRQELISEGIPVTPYNPGRADKIQRANVAYPLLKDGFIWLPESKKQPGKFMSWCNDMIEELVVFPVSDSDTHDDYVDSCVQAWNFLRDQGYLRSDLKVYDEDDDEYVKPKKQRVNPYGA